MVVYCNGITDTWSSSSPIVPAEVVLPRVTNCCPPVKVKVTLAGLVKSSVI